MIRTDVSDEIGNSIVINRLKSLNRWKQVRTIEQQDAALKSFLKNPTNDDFKVGKMVMLAIDTDSKKLEKSFALKVSDNSFLFTLYIILRIMFKKSAINCLKGLFKKMCV